MPPPLPPPPFLAALTLPDAPMQVIDGQPWLLVAFPMPPGPDGAVTATLAAPAWEIQTSLTALAVVTVVSGLIGLTLALAAAWHVLGRGLRPLRQLAEIAGAVAVGDWNRRAGPGGSQEVAQVAQAFDHMLDRLQAAFLAEQENQQRMRRFLADAAHELRTPLTAMNGFVEIMQSGAAGRPEDQHRALAALHAEGKRMARLVTQLLDLARLDARGVPELVELDLGTLLRDLQPALQSAYPDHTVTLSMTGPAPVRGYADGLKQVVWNLVDNARRHSPEGTPIRVTCRGEDGQVLCTVSDQGRGIPPADLPRVFDRFWRGDASRTRGTGGSGLGLAIVQSMVAAHGGQVQIHSEPGAGTTVTISLPRASAGT